MSIGARDVSLLHTRSHRPWGPPSLLYNGYLRSFPGVKLPGRGVDHNYAAVENELTYTSIPHLL
jgi:hypothetical protein